jgi:hypothetical protein
MHTFVEVLWSFQGGIHQMSQGLDVSIQPGLQLLYIFNTVVYRSQTVLSRSKMSHRHCHCYGNRIQAYLQFNLPGMPIQALKIFISTWMGESNVA